MGTLIGDMNEEKTPHVIDPAQSQTSDPSINEGAISDGNEYEVFKSAGANGVDFRTVTWQRLIIILLKVQIATGVLGIPTAMGTLGAVPGSLVVVGWQALNTCTLQHERTLTWRFFADNVSRHCLRTDRFPEPTLALP